MSYQICNTSKPNNKTILLCSVYLKPSMIQSLSRHSPIYGMAVSNLYSTFNKNYWHNFSEEKKQTKKHKMVVKFVQIKTMKDNERQ